MYNVYEPAKEAWEAGATLRARRRRFKRYTFGDQWADPVMLPDGTTISERELVTRLNHHPATNNIIRQLVKTVVGCYRSRNGATGEHCQTDARTFEEFLISGCAIQRLSHAGSVEQVSPPRFFIDRLSGGASGPVELIGQLHDFSLTHIIMRHAHGSRQRAAMIRRLYEHDQPRTVTQRAMLGESDADTLSFTLPQPGLCRLIEVWSFEPVERLRCHDTRTGRFYHSPLTAAQSIAAENKRRRRLRDGEISTRWELSGQWRCRFLTPGGEIVDEHTAQNHPYIYTFYPLIDGEVHPFVEDVIEQQRNLNRLLTLNDRILSTAAKGVLLFPENQQARDMPLDEAVDNWTAPDGVVLYRAIAGLPGPQQIVSTPGNMGIDGMVEQQLRLIEEVSGVGATMRGDPSGGNTNYYDRRRESAETALTDLFATFDAFTAARDAALRKEAEET